MPEMIFIFLLALVVFGPKRLPELARQLGKAMAEFKKASYEFRNQLETEMRNIELEERAKKEQEAPRILPPEKTEPPWPSEPVAGIVSRGNLDGVSAVEAAEPETPALPVAAEVPEPPLKSASSDA